MFLKSGRWKEKGTVYLDYAGAAEKPRPFTVSREWSNGGSLLDMTLRHCLTLVGREREYTGLFEINTRP